MSHVPAVELIDISKIYLLGAAQVVALRNINLTLEEGEFTSLEGPSGAGKSTLMNLIGTLESPDKGDLKIFGQSIGKLPDSELASIRNDTIGFVFQSFNLIPVLTVFENIELPMLAKPRLSRIERRERVLEAVENVGLTRFIDFYPDKLSGGQRQRVAIARAMIQRPKLLLADEPTANLDSKTSEQIMSLMIDLNQNSKTTFLFSSHDDRLLAEVSRVIELRDGEVARNKKIG